MVCLWPVWVKMCFEFTEASSKTTFQSSTHSVHRSEGVIVGYKMIVMPIWTRNSIYEKEIYDLKKSFYGELYWCLLLVWPHLAPCTCCTLHLRPRRTNYVTMRSRWLNMKKRRALMLCEAEDIWGRQQIGQKIRIFLPVPSKTLSGTRPCRQVWLWLTHHSSSSLSLGQSQPMTGKA